jgi:hypothetical protein
VAVVAQGIYFIPGDHRSIRFRSFITGETRLIASMARNIEHLSVSPDEKLILYSWPEATRRDLMLVENFR